MKNPLVLLLLSCSILAVASAGSSNKADRLHELIKSQISSPQVFRDDAWVHPDAEDMDSVVYAMTQDGMREADKFEALPGQPKGVKIEQYGGYVTVDPKHGRALFYYFVEAPKDPLKKPLVLWLNGGPGCSSLGAGAFLEFGPFFVNSDGKTLYKNDFAWNNVATIIFLESPAGVGFSYSNTTSDYSRSGDKQTAKDSYIFLINWLERFPMYKNHDFYITGESYAGHYVPQLASYILAKNSTVINLKGIAIGNAFIDATTNERAHYDYLWSHALVSDETYAKIQSDCNFGRNYTKDCSEALHAAKDETGYIDGYNIYAALCHDSSNTNSLNHNHPMRIADPCSGNYVYSYLNLQEVQKALHANTTGLNYPWGPCSYVISNWSGLLNSVLPVIKQLTKSSLRVWIYSGDIDAVVQVTSTRYSLHDLKLLVVSSWRLWHANGEVGGYVTEYKGLTFSTVRGAGHMVPHDQPERGLTLFSSFLEGKFSDAYN